MSEGNRTCQECGAEITPEQIAKREAGLMKGVLLCPVCVNARRQAAAAARQESAGPGGGGQAAPTAEEAISLVDEGETRGVSQIRNFSTTSTLAGTHHEDRLKRPMSGATDAPTRCRTFHAKLNDASVAYMNDQINEWVDSDARIFIKTVATTVGTFEGKHPEPHLIVTVFY